MFCSHDLWEKLQALDKEEVADQLGEYLTSYEIDAMFVRRDALVEHIQALIDVRGGGAVLYEAQR